MRKTIFTVSLVAVVAILLVIARTFFYPGWYQPPVLEKPRLDDITVLPPQSSPFADEPKRQAGTLVLDLAHDNDFIPRELNVLISRVGSRGFAFEYFKKIVAVKEEPPTKTAELKKVETTEERLERLKEQLRYANALAIILPKEAFSPKEMELLRGFVKKGGKLLLIGDPTRPSEINSVSAGFELMFETDYLYNLKEYDGNYRNIFITEFAQADGITKDLAKIALYSAGSVRSPDNGIAFTDRNTHSSRIETKGKLSPLALTEGSRVLAIADLTFMGEPYNAAWDNNKLISNVASWLTKSERMFTLSDFPYLLEDTAYIACADPAVIDIGIELRNLLVEKRKNPALGRYEDVPITSKDVVFMGFFKQAEKVEKYLKLGKISVTVKTEVRRAKEPIRGDGTTDNISKVDKAAEKVVEKEVTTTKVEVANIGQVYREEGTSLLYLDQSDDRDILIILSDTEKMMKDTIRSLRTGEFRNWLVSDGLAIYYAAKTEVKDSKTK